MQRFLSPVISFASGALVYGIGAAIGLWLMLVASNEAAFWPANGVTVILVLALGVRQLPWVAMGGLAAGVVIQTVLGTGPMGIAIAASDMVEVAVVVILARRLNLLASGLESVASVAALIAILSLATLLSAIGAAATLVWFEGVVFSDSLATLWRLNAASALIILAPHFAMGKMGWVGTFRSALRSGSTVRILEYLAIVAIIAASIVVMRHANVSMVSFFTVPLLWCAIRFGPPATAITSSLLSLGIVQLVIIGEWPNTAISRSLAWQLQRTELALSFITIPPLFVAAALAGLYAMTRALKESQERLRYALAGSGEGVWDWCIGDNSAYFSDGWYAILGYERDELEETADTWDQLRHPDDALESKRRIRDHLEGRTPRYSIEQRLRHKDGRWIWVLDRGSVVERDAKGRPYRAVGTIQDITRRRARQEELDRRAHHDSLTGLSNRAALGESFRRWNEQARSFCFVLIDLDHFKPINDRFGHQFGDHALLAIADRIRACLGKNDIAARIGGDEFALLIQAPPAEVEQTARLLIERICEPIGFADSVVTTGASIGIAAVANGGPDFADAYRLADIALYDAKASGGGAYRVAEASPAGENKTFAWDKTVLDLMAAAGEQPADQPARDREDATDERHG
ncbi:diguanylate cyclase domain-containing protein [Kaistia sp. UC242_56]|uniref:diguanylate cyclase domain-containing protein n=1 Tax=Kaistia sp. UC242_56 TaxID=3374625 RepID=UPI0037A316E4